MSAYIVPPHTTSTNELPKHVDKLNSEEAIEVLLEPHHINPFELFNTITSNLPFELQQLIIAHVMTYLDFPLTDYYAEILTDLPYSNYSAAYTFDKLEIYSLYLFKFTLEREEHYDFINSAYFENLKLEKFLTTSLEACEEFILNAKEVTYVLFDEQPPDDISRIDQDILNHVQRIQIRTSSLPPFSFFESFKSLKTVIINMPCDLQFSDIEQLSKMADELVFKFDNSDETMLMISEMLNSENCTNTKLTSKFIFSSECNISLFKDYEIENVVIDNESGYECLQQMKKSKSIFMNCPPSLSNDYTFTNLAIQKLFYNSNDLLNCSFTQLYNLRDLIITSHATQSCFESIPNCVTNLSIYNPELEIRDNIKHFKLPKFIKKLCLQNFYFNDLPRLREYENLVEIQLINTVDYNSNKTTSKLFWENIPPSIELIVLKYENLEKLNLENPKLAHIKIGTQIESVKLRLLCDQSSVFNVLAATGSQITELENEMNNSHFVTITNISEKVVLIVDERLPAVSSFKNEINKICVVNSYGLEMIPFPIPGIQNFCYKSAFNSSGTQASRRDFDWVNCTCRPEFPKVEIVQEDEDVDQIMDTDFDEVMVSDDENYDNYESFEEESLDFGTISDNSSQDEESICAYEKFMVVWDYNVQR